MWPLVSGILDSIDRTLKLSNRTVVDFVIQQEAIAEARLANSGSFDTRTGGAGGWTGIVDEWIHEESQLDPGFDPNLYEGGYFSVTGDTGKLTGAALDTYHSLDTTRTWTLTQTPVGVSSVTGTLKVREKADVSNEVTATLTLTAENDSGM